MTTQLTSSSRTSAGARFSRAAPALALGRRARRRTRRRPGRPAGKVVIGAFADGGLDALQGEDHPAGQGRSGFDIQFLEDEYGVTLEKWFADAQSGAGQYDLYLLDDPWVPQFGAAEVLEDLGAGGIDGADKRLDRAR